MRARLSPQAGFPLFRIQIFFKQARFKNRLIAVGEFAGQLEMFGGAFFFASAVKHQCDVEMNLSRCSVRYVCLDEREQGVKIFPLCGMGNSPVVMDFCGRLRTRRQGQWGFIIFRAVGEG